MTEGTWVNGAPRDVPTRLEGDRYRDEGRIARGGMCEVRRVYDTDLGFRAAMKILLPELLDVPGAVARFRAECQLTARLQHPGIVAVYDRGELADGRPWFTMTEVRGDTLDTRIRAIHPDASDRALRGVLGLLLTAIETVAYAHSQGVVHRDLKPANLMVGAFNEVRVLDWGVARDVNASPLSTADGPEPSDARATRMGDVLGTPSYMSPEQARGDNDRVGPASDVYSLGAVLYEVLTGRTADTGTGREVWLRLLSGPPALFGEGTPPVPAPLEEMCRRAMASRPHDRYFDATEMAAALRDWLEGAKRRERALAILAGASELKPGIAQLRERAEDARQRAEALLTPLTSRSPVEARHAAWELEDRATEAERAAVVLEVQWQRAVGNALEQVPNLREAHAELADHYAERLVAAEQSRDLAAIARCEALLQQHDRGRHAALLSGRGTLTLHTDPPGATVQLFRLVDRHRRRVAEPRGTLGTTPLQEVPLERGSWLLELQHPDCEVVRYPVFLGRGEDFVGIRPGATEPFAVHLPPAGTLGPDDCYVPGGPFLAGGDPQAADALPRRRVWVEPFVIARFPVTRAEYLAFLNDVGDASLLPRARVGSPAIVADGEGFALHPDHAGRERWPVSGIDWHAAAAYARWAGGRLPDELEWSKAARGVDGRFFAWGDHIEAGRANILDHTDGPPALASVDAHPEDCSPYGVRGTIGGVRDWCANVWRRDGKVTPDAPDASTPVATRGGSFASTGLLSRAAIRFGDPPQRHFDNQGFRICRSLVS